MNVFKSSLVLSALVVGPAVLPISPSSGVPGVVTVWAQESATSRAVGVAVPKGAASFDAIAPNATGVLTALAKEKQVRLTPKGESAEVFVWQGAAYKSERATFLRMALRSALTAKGFKVSSIDSNMVDTRLFTHFPSDDENLPFHPDIWKQPGYFTAVNEAKGQGAVGVWLESNNVLVLSLLPVELEAKAAGLGMPAIPAGAILVKDPDDAMKGIAPPRMPSFVAMARLPKVARGQVKDAQGKPIAGAQVVVESSALGGFRTLHQATTNAQGVYQVSVSTGVCRISSAWCRVNANGKLWALPLHAADSQLQPFDSKQGTVENFTLRTYGSTSAAASANPANDKLYYGGSVRIGWTSEIAEGGTMELTLTPQGPLVGGGQGRTIVFRFPNQNYGAILNDVPLGRYTARVRLISEGETVPVQLERYGTSQVAESLRIDFEPVSSTQPDFGYSGVRQFHVMLHL